MTSPTTDWRACGELRALLHSATATELACESGLPVTELVPRYLRLKFGESALVGYDATLAGQIGTVPVHVRTFADQSRAESLQSKWSNKRRDDTLLSPPVTRTSHGSSVFFAFPNDNELAGLRRVVTPRSWKKVLPTLQGFATHNVSRNDRR